MKKVLQIIGKLYIGGAEKVARDIGLYADPEKVQADYVVFEDEVGAYEPELLAKGCRIYHLDPPSQGYGAYVRRLKALIRDNGYDAVHCHTMFSSGWAMWAARQQGVPLRIAHSHSIRGFEHRNWLKNAYERAMRRVILKDATHLVACGEKAGCWLFGEKVFLQRGITVLNGIDTGEFAYDPAARREVREALRLQDKYVIGHVGHLAAVKNQAFLLEQLPQIQKKIPHAVLLLLGEGSDRQMLQEKAKALGIGDSVIFTGNVTDVHRYLSAMDVFAFPSLYEGMPLSMVEVQANGLPCVLSDRVPRDVFLTDLLHPISLEEPERWTDTLCSLTRSNPEPYARILRQSGFDTAAMVQKIYDLYEM